uniref:Long-chain-fatty-acid--CoA ligase n=1 Tax=Oxyrrhis marina TaxID=2969 RepID=A0A7S4GP78_OXYMA
MHSGPFVISSLRRNCQQRPQQTATIDAATGRQHTYAQLTDRVARLAGVLLAGGLRAGDRVGVLMLNSDVYLEAFFGVPWAGGVVLPANIRLAPPELVEVFTDAEISVLLVDETFAAVLPAIRSHIPSLQRVLYTSPGAAPAGTEGYEAALAAAAPAPDVGRGAEDVFGLFYTGGTTGKAKGVMLTHANVMVNGLGHTAALRYDSDSSYLHSAPMFHLADGASSFAITMVGGTHVFIPKFDPKDMLEAIQKYKVKKAMMVPVMIQAMLAVPVTADCSSLETILYGAAPMPEALLTPAMARFPRAEFVQGYGMTETSPAITMLMGEEHYAGNERMRSVGRAVSWTEVRIVDDKDQEVPRGTVGEIVTRGPHVMAGYWRKPELTAEALRGGWMHTGDVGRMDEEGFVFICDRLKDMIITGGENVYSAETEAAVMSFPAVALCAVIGVPDKKYGQLVTAVVQPKEGQAIDGEALMKHCRERIAGFKCPRKVIVETLPVSGAGKILKHVIREKHAAGLEYTSKL